MFKRILLPVDLSDKHQRAIDTAADLANQSGGEVILLHVIETIASLPLEEERAFYHRLEKSAREHLAKLTAALKQRRVVCRAEVLLGNRGPEVVRHSAESGIDLIIVTAPRIDPKNLATGWASLSWKISLLAGCPVLLVK
jgi:nucleotide-binding universal stress UspA family protein